MINVGMKLKKTTSHFFDNKKIMRKVDAATRRVYSRFGAFVRRRAKSSIRKRKKKTSEAGNPPFSKTGTLKRLIFFSYDPSSKSVVIGPIQHGRGGAPRLLEEGGSAVRHLAMFAKRQGRDERGRFTKKTMVRVEKDVDGTAIYRHDRRAPGRRVTYKPRPFMQPAYDHELPSVKSQLKNSIR